MSTEQPKWKLIANLGDIDDVDIATYGGFLVYVDETGIYPPEVEMYETDETGGTRYRFILEPPRFKTFVEGKYESNFSPAQKDISWYWHREWFVKYIPSVAATCGKLCSELLRNLLSQDPIERAYGYRDLVGYFGPEEFDHYPVTLTEAEAQERYKEKVCKSRQV